MIENQTDTEDARVESCQHRRANKVMLTISSQSEKSQKWENGKALCTDTVEKANGVWNKRGMATSSSY